MIPRWSALVLVAANLIPIIGVFWFDWQVLDILLLYWTESVIVGLLNIVRMAFCSNTNPLAGLRTGGDPKKLGEAVARTLPNASFQPLKFFLIPFFAVHYGMFCFGHYSAVVGIFADAGLSAGLALFTSDSLGHSFWLAVAAIAASHLYSLVFNYFGQGEYRRTSVSALMHRPYGRIILMHFVVMIGGALVMFLGNPLPMLLVLVAGKIMLDLRAHEKERLILEDELAGQTKTV